MCDIPQEPPGESERLARWQAWENYAELMDLDVDDDEARKEWEDEWWF